MGKNKRFTPAEKAEMLALYMEKENYAAVGAEIGHPRNSVKHAIDQQLSDPSIKKIYDESKKNFNERFADAAERLIDKLVLALENKVDSVIAGDGEAKLNEITTALGTMYDKRAVTVGESTDSVKITIDLPKEAEKYAK